MLYGEKEYKKRMKQLLIWLGILFLIASCSTQKEAIKEEKNVEKELVETNMEYGIKTAGSKFESWYLKYKDPTLFRSQKYYEDWNKKYVTAWNRRVIRSEKSRFFESSIDYTPGISYSFELNHELFYYFLYIENVLKIKIMQDGPKMESINDF